MLFPILKSEQDILKLLKNNLPPCSKDFLCFFSSHLKAFITDPLFMTIPIEDKIVHRGYAVFETTKIFGNKIYQLDKHIDRLTNSLKKINLTPMYKEEEFREILMKLASIARKMEPDQDIELRYFYSAGLGNFSVFVNENLSSFYAIAYRTDFSVRPIQGVVERSVFVEEIKKNIVSSKNTNYLVNAIVTKKAKEEGGYMGIMVDEHGNFLEAPTSNVAFFMNNGDFSVPPFEKTLIGTTVIRVMEYVEKELIPNGLVKNISRDYVNISNFAETVKEAMIVGGDFAIPILKLNNVNLADEPGPLTRMIQDFLLNDKKSDEVAEEIPHFKEEFNF
jgi:branched-subunit amino acid aminotransferase/4-amino-4-deoxychorismate lyase